MGRTTAGLNPPPVIGPIPIAPDRTTVATAEPAFSFDSSQLPTDNAQPTSRNVQVISPTKPWYAVKLSLTVKLCTEDVKLHAMRAPKRPDKNWTRKNARCSIQVFFEIFRWHKENTRLPVVTEGLNIAPDTNPVIPISENSVPDTKNGPSPEFEVVAMPTEQQSIIVPSDSAPTLIKVDLSAIYQL